MNKNKYVLITAARNEEAYIEKTIQAVISQTILPKKWVIVSDGSTDKTDEIVERYTKKSEFIELVETTNDVNRNFGSKARALHIGCEHLGELDYQFIGNLDADISVEPSYYENILLKFQNNNKLGIAGGVRYDLQNRKFKKIITSSNSVAGAFQLFRRQCFETIGGYMPLEYGGIDAVAEIMARMYGWHVESFSHVKVYHNRPTASAEGNTFRAGFRYGVKFYLIGYHPLFMTLRILYRMCNRSILLRGPLEIFGYFWAALCRYERPVSDDFVKYLRLEQMNRLRSLNFTGKDSVI
jgi:glycosyltransferase involved in cell wall biosynthesis